MKRKAVSSILGTVLVLAVTLALGGLLYSYSQGLFGSLTQQAQLQVSSQLVVSPSGDAALQFSLQNYGNVEINVTHVSLLSPTGTITYSNHTTIVIEPGQTVQEVQVGIQGVVAGQYYTLLIEGVTSGGKTYQTSQEILAQS
ncbi:hypothetical protein GCM10007116_05340 [Sulfodiicoccus acidiphilus]|uniref:Flagellar biosynthesis protein FlaG n=1 Tax=Sulfodiicoccus acidiphilus TaxID=1670455 RepID=A0A830H011_9CREN|nr:archaellin/type IV pilin N-terminal domain-containing protein [Sulfodiicoccus acidiphilus]GGT90451.1 hypothetical protein GCM10007116_05340 [Sulfodiicoccus acidiphilus]